MAKYIELESIANYLNEDELNNLLDQNKDNPYFEKMVDFTPVKNKIETPKPDNKIKERLKILKEQVSYNPVPKSKEFITESYKSVKNPKLKNFLLELDQAGVTNSDDRDYLVKLAEKESNFDPNIINTLGYRGYYQFGKDALLHTGFKKEDFKNPLNQHIAALKLRDLNLIALRNYINKPIDINGQEIIATKNMLGAMAHNAGATGTKDFLNKTKFSNYAKRGYRDAYNTSITDYAKLFTNSYII